MTPRVLFATAAIAAAGAVGAGVVEKRVSRSVAHRADDLETIDTLRAAAETLHRGILESRAGIQLSFDSIDRAALALRTAHRAAETIRTRGPKYTSAADALDRFFEQARGDEAAMETFKTDLAILRSSSRYFPTAMDALIHRLDDAQHAMGGLRADVEHFEAMPTREAGSKISSKMAALDAARAAATALRRDVNALRADAERYEENPTRATAARLAAEIETLEGARTRFEGAAADDFDVVVGHTRLILERRERVDQLARVLVRSKVHYQGEVARAEYETATWHYQIRRLLLGIGAGLLAGLSVIMAIAGLVSARASSRATPHRHA